MYCVNPMCVNFGNWENEDVVPYRQSAAEPHRYFCRACKTNFRDRYRVYFKTRPIAREYVAQKRPDNGKVLCYCPKCRREHWMALFWTGRAKIPPKFCENCRNNSEPILSEEPVYHIFEPAAREMHAWT